MRRPHRIATVAGGAILGGGLLALADWPVHAAPLQLVAFVPLLLAVGACEGWWWAALAGIAFGAVRCAPFSPGLAAFPPIGWIGVPAYLLLLHAAFAVVCFAARRMPGPGRALVQVGAWVALETLDAHMPMWGSALSLAAAWSPLPWAIRFVHLTGPAGVGAIVVGSQSVALAWARTAAPLRVAGVAAMVLSAAACANAAPRSDGTFRVAAIGWTSPRSDGDLERFVRTAASAGARLVVTPEAALVARPGERAAMLERVGGLARENHVHVAIAYIDEADRENRVAFVAPDGRVVAEYAKTHLVPLVERVQAGSGRIATVDIDGIRVGAMICQDDNFSDVARAYARDGVDIVVTPTYEMSPTLAALHMRSGRLRAIEGRFAYVRAVANGTSAIVSSDGAIVGARDHLATGAGVVVADVPVRHAPMR